MAEGYDTGVMVCCSSNTGVTVQEFPSFRLVLGFPHSHRFCDRLGEVPEGTSEVHSPVDRSFSTSPRVLYHGYDLRTNDDNEGSRVSSADSVGRHIGQGFSSSSCRVDSRSSSLRFLTPEQVFS